MHDLFEVIGQGDFALFDGVKEAIAGGEAVVDGDLVKQRRGGRLEARLVEGGQQLRFTGFGGLAADTLQVDLDFAAGLGRYHEGEPVGRWLLRAGGEHLHLVAAGEFVAQGHEAMVHLGADAGVAHVGVEGIGKVERRGALGQRFELAFGGEDEDLRREEVHFHRVEKVERIGVRVFENLGDRGQPLV